VLLNFIIFRCFLIVCFTAVLYVVLSNWFVVDGLSLRYLSVVVVVEVVKVVEVVDVADVEFVAVSCFLW